MKPAVSVLGAVMLALAAAWTGARLYSLRSAGGERGMAVPAGEASAPGVRERASPDAALPAARIPERLPNFTLNDLQGKPTPSSGWQGRSLVLNFWATWCDPCRREIPLLEKLQKQWAARGVAVVGVAIDHPEKVAAFARQFSIDYPLLTGEQDALDLAGRLGVQTPVFPFTVFSDRRGRIVALFVGELHQPQADLILGVVSDLNQDRLPLAAARQAIAGGLRAIRAKG